MSPLFLLAAILIPIIGGFLILPIGFADDRKRAAWCEIIALLSSVCVWINLLAGTGEPVTVYSFAEGYAVVFRADGLSSLFAGMVSVMWPLVLLYAFEYMSGDHRKNAFFAFYVMTYGVTLGLAFAANMITMYVFYEMLTLVTIPLVTHYGNRESMFAGRKYTAYTIGGASLAFFAVVLSTVHGSGGSFVYGGSLAGAFRPEIMRIAFLFGFFGFGAKAAVFPLHDWLPTASAAPTPVTALLHAVAVVNAGVFAVMRMTYYVFGTELMRGSTEQKICLAAAIFSLTYAALMALREKHFKRRLAYSTMSNLSYMLFGAMLMTADGFLGAASHMLFHGIVKMYLFLCAGAFMHQTGKSYVYETNGVGKRMPVTFAMFTLGGLSLTGIPLFSGFVSKWKLIAAGIAEGTALSCGGAAALIAAAFLCAMYTLTISVRAFFAPPGADRFREAGSAKEAGWKMLVPIVFFGAVDIWFGCFSGQIMNFITGIARGRI